MILLTLGYHVEFKGKIKFTQFLSESPPLSSYIHNFYYFLNWKMAFNPFNLFKGNPKVLELMGSNSSIDQLLLEEAFLS